MIERKLEKISSALNRFEVRLLVLLLIVLAAGLLYKHGASPEQHSLKRYEGMVEGNTSARSYLSADQAKLKQQLNNKTIRSALRNAETALPGDLRFDSEVLALAPIFAASGLTVQSLTPGTTNNSPPISGLAITITASSNTNSAQPLINFLHLLNSQVRVGHNESITANGPLWVVSKISISSTSSTAASAEKNSQKSTYTISGVVLSEPPSATSSS